MNMPGSIYECILCSIAHENQRKRGKQTVTGFLSLEIYFLKVADKVTNTNSNISLLKKLKKKKNLYREQNSIITNSLEWKIRPTSNRLLCYKTWVLCTLLHRRKNTCPKNIAIMWTAEALYNEITCTLLFNFSSWLLSQE